MLEGPYADEAPFWDGIGHGELRLPRCGSCHAWNWPPVPRCPHCGSFDHDWPSVDPSGVVYSWTRVHRASKPEWTDRIPYVVLLVEIPGAGNSRILGALDGPDRALAIGAPVVGSFRPPSDTTLGMPSIAWSIATTTGATA